MDPAAKLLLIGPSVIGLSILGFSALRLSVLGLSALPDRLFAGLLSKINDHGNFDPAEFFAERVFNVASDVFSGAAGVAKENEAVLGPGLGDVVKLYDVRM